MESRGRSVWVLADDRPGNAGQCLGVAEALGEPFEVKPIAYRWLACLPNILLGATMAGVTADSRLALGPPWPDVVIAAGRRTAPVARAIKRLAGGRPFLVQIMDPGPGGRDDLDLIAVPRHDGVASGDKLLPIIGAPHRMTRARLAEAAAFWEPRFAALPRPWIGLIVGGSTRRRAFTEEMGRELGGLASRLAGAAGGALLVSTSRRSGAAGEGVVASLTAPAFVYRWEEEGENPYVGILGAADVLVVTGDSVSMLSEAASVEVPLYVYAPAGLITEKHARFHQDLYARGYARPLAGTLEMWRHPSLNAAAEIAAAIPR